jgi:hypothetical protein
MEMTFQNLISVISWNILQIQEILSGENDMLQSNLLLQKGALNDLSKIQIILPVTFGDHTHFYSSREHATDVWIRFHSNDNALQNTTQLVRFTCGIPWSIIKIILYWTASCSSVWAIYKTIY